MYIFEAYIFYNSPDSHAITPLCNFVSYLKLEEVHHIVDASFITEYSLNPAYPTLFSYHN